MSESQENLRNILSGQKRGAGAALTRVALSLLEPIYASVIVSRNALYDAGILRSNRLGRPTISVGNITSGGSGKTPVALWLAGKMLADGRRPAILLRGYGRTNAGVSDEQTLLQQSFVAGQVRVIASPNRVGSAQLAIQENPLIDLFILDDAMQHRRAARDVNLTLISAPEPFGYGHVLPRGLLREPLSGLRRADAMLITHASEAGEDQLRQIEQQIRRHNPLAPIFKADHAQAGLLAPSGESAEMSSLRGRRYFAACGIGSPQSFFSSLRQFGGDCAGSRIFSDHHDFSNADLEQIRSEAARLKAEMILVTEKDWVKISQLPGNEGSPKIWRVKLALRFWPDDELKLLDLIRQKIIHH